MKCCQEAIKLLETEGESKQSTLRKKDCLLAHAYFVFHLLETQANQVASTVSNSL